jgi:hypothetical protein
MRFSIKSLIFSVVCLIGIVWLSIVFELSPAPSSFSWFSRGKTVLISEMKIEILPRNCMIEKNDNDIRKNAFDKVCFCKMSLLSFFNNPSLYRHYLEV